ncbi:MAG TPA: 2-isopropylmalate synthase [Mycobacteriales bacterium]|nr:2-isopropylmalate synthase [Mycobacteriales bacterium]
MSQTSPADIAGDRITIFDTTLRDGEQSPGIALGVVEKLEIAEQLARLGVDVIEAGFPAASPGDFEGVRAIAETVKGPSVAALCRTREEDVARAWEAISPAERPRIHTFISTSPIHRDKKLRMTTDQVLAETARAVAQASALCGDVEFSAEDATRTELDFLIEVYAAAIENGATTVNVPDTVGFVLPEEYVVIMRELQERVPGAAGVTWSVHCHNDLGLATANSLAAVRAGARQVEVCVNGIGERAGNAALEEVVMALRTHSPTLGFTTGIETREITRTSRLVSMLAGYPVQRNKSVVGANAFSHESGIHQHGVLMERTTYEIMNPEDVGLAGNTIVLGKHSGRHAFVDALHKLGMHLEDAAAERAFTRFKELADRKSQITDKDIEALATEQAGESAAAPDAWSFDWLAVAGGTDTEPKATVRLSRGQETVEETATGDGMIDAACNAVAKAVGATARLVAFQVAAVDEGSDAIGDVSVVVEVDGTRVTARGVSTDVVEASARAYLHAVNKVVSGTAVPHRVDKP